MLAHDERSIVERLDVHDRFQLECKIEYPSRADSAVDSYTTDIYFFLPEPLNANATTYGPARFYEDVHNYIRLQTPRLTLDQILDETDVRSPLTMLARRLASLPSAVDEDFVRSIEYKTRILMCVFRVALRETLRFMREELRGCAELDAVEALEFAHGAVDRASTILGRYRALGKLVATPALPSSVRSSFRLADEFASLVVNGFGGEILKLCDRTLPGPGARDAAAALRSATRALLAAEASYRKTRGLKSSGDGEEDFEELVYRKGLLKRFVYTDLFLKIQEDDRTGRWQQVLFGISAGISMAFATAVTFLAMAHMAQLSWGLFAILVISYVFKDRIKDGSKAFFSKVLNLRLPDHGLAIVDPASDARIGRCDQKVAYLGDKHVPAEVRRLRNLARTEYEAEKHFVERVLWFRNTIRIYPARIARGRERIDAVTHVFRYNVRHLLHSMDDPTTELELFDAESGDLARVVAPKTYHVNMVFGVPSREGATDLFKLRVVLDRNGIRRVERLAADGAVWRPQ